MLLTDLPSLFLGAEVVRSEVVKSPKSIVRWFSTNHFTSNYRLRPKFHMVLSTSDPIFLFSAILLRTIDIGLFHHFGLSTSAEIRTSVYRFRTLSHRTYHFGRSQVDIDFRPYLNLRTIDFGQAEVDGSKWQFSPKSIVPSDFRLRKSEVDAVLISRPRNHE